MSALLKPDVNWIIGDAANNNGPDHGASDGPSPKSSKIWVSPMT